MTDTTSPWTFGPELLRDEGARFRIWSPEHQSPLLMLDGGQAQVMNGMGNGWFELSVAQARPGMTYEFVVGDGMRVPDPASRFQPVGTAGPSRLCDPDGYRWQHLEWRGRSWHEAVIYELHVGTFSAAGTYEGVRAHLGHLRELGVTAVELMPLGEFGGTRGWGYDGVLPYAPHHAYGTPDQLKALIDAAHGHDLMVFLDVIYNHFGPQHNFLPKYARFFREDNCTAWGPAIDYREPAVRAFAIENALYWLDEFRFDGLRLDAVHAIEDETHPDILDELARRVRERFAGRHIHLILENERNEAGRLERHESNSVGRFTAQWNDDWHNCAHVLATGETEGYYFRAFADRPMAGLARAMSTGFAYQGEPSPIHEGRPRGEPSYHLPPTAFVDFLQNHDQVGNRALGERLSVLAQPEAVETLTAILILSPQVPMLFMGEEWGSERPFLFFCDYSGELGEAVREGRRREFAGFNAFADPTALERIPDPTSLSTFEQSKLDWDEPAADPYRRRLAFVRRLLELRARHVVPALEGATGHAGNARDLADRAVEVSWRLRRGAQLSMLANLGDHEVQNIERPAGALLFAWPDETATRIVDGVLPGWSSAWFLEQAEWSR